MLSKTEKAFHRRHEAMVKRDVKEAAMNKDWEGVRLSLASYGIFLERHPEALEVLE